MNLSESVHRRLNPLTGEWVLVSPHRTKRPWQGRQESATANHRPAHDPKCYLCPGNSRAGGEQNPPYTGTHVFTNDFAAIMPGDPGKIETASPLLQAQPQLGECRVICFSPRHDLSLPEMETSGIAGVIDVWCEQYAEMSPRYPWIQIFENKGDVMGCSNPHPHGQIWASTQLPNEAVKELRCQIAYFEENARPLLGDYAQLELTEGVRLIERNEDWVVVVPFWAVWPYEALLLPLRPGVATLLDLTAGERASLAAILKTFLTRYDNLFEVSFPYSMGWHAAPSDGKPHPEWQLHAHFYPPLLRSATVKKFMVGYEMMAEAQRDITAEQAAETLRSLSTVHYKSPSL